ncbi:MAG: tetratricopeptide repeat protein, partial [Candidatus Omnitrophica bacterium]|nr:tetratricopeptide repeat protein [Candidatus Omnitrophota bacterium]
TGQWDNCITTLAQVLQFQKNDPDVYGTLAVALMRKGDYEKALALLKEGLQYAKDNKTAARFYQNTGHILIQKKNFAAAKNEFQMGVARDWSNLDCHFGLAMAYIGMEDPQGAKKSLEDLLRVDPKNKKAAELLQQVENILKQPAQMNLQLQGGTGQAGISLKSKSS